jgi:3-keto-L-gulonate-6-phosphate decarboxylase
MGNRIAGAYRAFAAAGAVGYDAGMWVEPPVIQIALDYPTIEEALAMAEVGVKAGVDWLEVGTPLIVAQGVNTIGKLKRAFPGYPVLAD